MISTSTCCNVATCHLSHPYIDPVTESGLSQSAFLHLGKIIFK